jgi:hypothetical protein
MKDHRIVKNDAPVSYTCQNSKYRTDTDKGHSHGNHDARGNVFTGPLVVREAYSLWLEHVAHENGGEWYWFMWYKDGIPTIPLSGIFDKADLSKMLASIGQFVPE